MKKISYDDFAREVKSSGLKPRWCHQTHWQIMCGSQLVNVWPNTRKRGLAFQADGEKSRGGTVSEAIRLAGPADKPKVDLPPPWEEQKEHVGLIRRFWRRIW